MLAFRGDLQPRQQVLAFTQQPHIILASGARREAGATTKPTLASLRSSTFPI